VTLDFPLPERQRLALYLVRHLRGLNVAPYLRNIEEYWGNLRNMPEN